MPQKIEFVFSPSSEGPLPHGEARYLWNVDQGADIDALRAFILEVMPVVVSEDVTTTYRVLSTRRNEETLSSFPKLRALIEVYCEGNHLPEWEDVEGFYEVLIDGNATETRVLCSRLSPVSQFKRIVTPMPSLGEMYATRHA